MKRNPILMCVLMIAFLGVCLAQAPPKAPTPGPEHKKLGYFVGTWSFDGEMKAGESWPGGKVTGSDTVTWGPGRFSLVMNSTFSSPMGNGKSISIIAYDASEKVYTYNAWDSMGMGESAKGNVKDGIWTWTGESKAMGPTPVKTRVTIKEVSPTATNFKFETSKDGYTWTTVMEAKQTKVTKKTTS